MLTSKKLWKRNAFVRVRYMIAISAAGASAFAGLKSISAFAEDIGVVPSGAARTSAVRVVGSRPSPRPSIRPTVPRPIKDETTPVAQAVPPAPAAQTLRTTPHRRAQEQAVNLDALTAPTPPPRPAVESAAPKSSSYSSGNPHAAAPSGILPNFKFYFDFILRSWKGKDVSGGESAFGFDTYHQRLMVEFTPTPDLIFQADLLQQKYFESDYMLSPKVQVRWGRIWIPFDDLSPHNLFGGRINTSEFRQPNETAFLPDIWADLGVGMRFTLADSPSVSSELHLYVVNGFQENRGGSPVQGEGTTGTNAPYPTFDGTSGGTGDNNNDKAFGARWHSVFGRRVGLGASIYHDVYTNGHDAHADGSPAPKEGIDMLGLDVQLRPTNTTEIRMGYVTMKVGLDPTLSSKSSFSRGGSYIELGQRFGLEDRWKFLLRAGSSQNDNRVVDVSDKTIVGATILKNFGFVETQFNYFRDLHQVASKIAYDYGEFRIVTAF
jgi:hypothetical protein